MYRKAEQNQVWAGMAKETAHQIGTPLSSLLGWIAILKAEKVDETYIDEIEKDVHRLNIIANRFSKIGSIPELKKRDVVLITRQAFDYLKFRSSTQISFSFITSEKEIQTLINEELFGWVIENIIKNAIDAIQGKKGSVTYEIQDLDNKVILDVTDTGKGIPSSSFKSIFNPGYSTKERGWGLGLSLVKRIVEEQLKGKIYVLNSKIDQGTTFRIILKK